MLPRVVTPIRRTQVRWRETEPALKSQQQLNITQKNKILTNTKEGERERKSQSEKYSARHSPIRIIRNLNGDNKMRNSINNKHNNLIRTAITLQFNLPPNTVREESTRSTNYGSSRKARSDFLKLNRDPICLITRGRVFQSLGPAILIENILVFVCANSCLYLAAPLVSWEWISEPLLNTFISLGGKILLLNLYIKRAV